MRKRNKRFRMWLSEEEHDLMTDGFFDAKVEVTFAAYIRKICTGEWPHPNFAPDSKEAVADKPEWTDVPNVGKVKGSAEMRHHIHSMVIAAEMLRVQQNPEYQDLINKFPKEFKAMVNMMRGYKFDDDARLKSPLPGAPERHPR